MSHYEVMRFVAKDEPGNFLERDVEVGEIFYPFHKATYGCVNEWVGVAVSEVKDEYPFFEFPANAVQLVVT